MVQSFFLVFNGIEKEDADKSIASVQAASKQVRFKQHPNLQFEIKVTSAQSQKDDNSINQVITRAHQASRQ